MLLSQHQFGGAAEIYHTKRRTSRLTHGMAGTTASEARGVVIENQAYSFGSEGIFLYAQGYNWIKFGEQAQLRSANGIYVYQKDDTTLYSD